MEWRRDQDRRRQSGAEKSASSSLNSQQHLSRRVAGSNSKTNAPVDKEKLRALFSPDSDSDDDPIAAIKRRQIAANKRRRELKNVESKRASVPDEFSSTNNNCTNNEEASENNIFPKRRCTKTQNNDTITNEREEVKQVIVEPSLSDAADLTVETNLTKDITSTPKISQSDLLLEASTLRQAPTLNEKEVIIAEKDNGEESLSLEKNDAANETEQSANSKSVDLNEDAPMQKSCAESDTAAVPTIPAEVTPAAAALATPAETKPIVAKEVKTPKSVSWTALHSQHLLVRSPVVFNPRDKVAAFDLDQTLANWNVSPGSFPSSVQQYELWNSSVIDKLRKLDKDGYKLVIFSNQGGIKGALQGKIARENCSESEDHN